MNKLPEDHAKKVCKMFQGAESCAFLVHNFDGDEFTFACAKGDPLEFNILKKN